LGINGKDCSNWPNVLPITQLEHQSTIINHYIYSNGGDNQKKTYVGRNASWLNIQQLNKTLSRNEKICPLTALITTDNTKLQVTRRMWHTIQSDIVLSQNSGGQTEKIFNSSYSTR